MPGVVEGSKGKEHRPGQSGRDKKLLKLVETLLLNPDCGAHKPKDKPRKLTLVSIKENSSMPDEFTELCLTMNNEMVGKSRKTVPGSSVVVTLAAAAPSFPLFLLSS